MGAARGSVREVQLAIVLSLPDLEALEAGLLRVRMDDRGQPLARLAPDDGLDRGAARQGDRENEPGGSGPLEASASTKYGLRPMDSAPYMCVVSPWV
jgi:hypothetical protein